MTPIDLTAVIIVCATTLAWHAISRHYARRDMGEIEAARAETTAQARQSLQWAADAKARRDEVVAARDEVTSALAQRDWAKVNVRLENLEARVRR